MPARSRRAGGAGLSAGRGGMGKAGDLGGGLCPGCQRPRCGAPAGSPPVHERQGWPTGDCVRAEPGCGTAQRRRLTVAVLSGALSMLVTLVLSAVRAPPGARSVKRAAHADRGRRTGGGSPGRSGVSNPRAAVGVNARPGCVNRGRSRGGRYRGRAAVTALNRENAHNRPTAHETRPGGAAGTGRRSFRDAVTRASSPEEGAHSGVAAVDTDAGVRNCRTVSRPPSRRGVPAGSSHRRRSGSAGGRGQRGPAPTSGRRPR